MSSNLRYVLIIFVLCFLQNLLLAQQEPREYQRWGEFGVGKLVTTQNNLNCIADGQLRWPAWAHHPSMEYPYNPEPGGRHVMYAVGISFHIGGYCEDLGPSYKPELDDTPGSPMVESGDRTYYRYYTGFHYDGFPKFISDSEDASVPVSNDTLSWPLINGERQFPDFYPTGDWYHDSRYPDYQNAYQSGMAQQMPLLKDSETGWPGAGADGRQIADQESFSVNFSRNVEWVSNDLDQGKLMVYSVLRGLSYAGDFYDDFLVYSWAVTNVGTEPIINSFLGVLVDFDFPWASYQSYASYSEVDCYAYDEEMQMAYGWDGDGDIQGASYGDWAHPVPAKLTDESIVTNPAMAGVMFLKTPVKDDGSGEVGVATFDAFCLHIKNHVYGIGSGQRKFYNNNIMNRNPEDTLSYDPDDADKDGIDDWTWEHPYPKGKEANYESGYKGEITLNAGPFTLEPGETDTLIAVFVMGNSRDALFKNANLARKLYESGWKPIKPPLEPVLRTEVSSGQVKLIWDDRSEIDSLNEAHSRQPFEGYKLYRSTDGGQTWGASGITDENGTVVDYVPLGQWDLANGITGPSPALPTFQLGTDSGMDDLAETAMQDTTIIEVVDGDTVFYGEFSAGEETGRRIYIDENVIDGFTYKYAVVAYSSGNQAEGITPVQSSKTLGPHIVSVVPHAPTAERTSELDRVKVVPNPYRVIADWEMSQDERMIKFTHLPEKCTIKIFNVAGEQINTLHHNANSPIDSEEIWNLRTTENREVAPGLYFYYLESEIGKKRGKFVIIK